jgi:hypothetical protein
MRVLVPVVAEVPCERHLIAAQLECDLRVRKAPQRQTHPHT